VDGLDGKTATAAEFHMDWMHSNAYRVWQQMGSPAHPSEEQTRQLERAGALEETGPEHTIQLDGGKAGIDLNLPRQGVALVRLRVR
jgi:xylan 1,4-beta-xylosidase